MLDVRYVSEIEDDLVAAATWYVTQRQDLGEEFLQNFHATVRLIATTGQTRRLVVQDYRRLHLKRFPYAVYFTASGATAVVYLVIHASRDPESINRHLRDRR